MVAVLVPAGILLFSGLVVLSSISLKLLYLQLAWLGVGCAILIFFRYVGLQSLLSYRWLSWVLYGLVVALLLIALLTAPTIRNTRSWIVVGPLTFQPVELAKIALIVAYAQYFSRRHLAIARWPTILGSFALFILPAGLTMLQPDLGSTVVLFGIWFGFLLVSGLPRRRLFAALAAFLVIGFLGWHSVLKPYQRERIVGVFYPERNALTFNYSVIQAKIAIASAGWLGKGYGQGSETQLGFLSEPANDFILAALIEEWGILAGFIVLGAFLWLEVGILRIGVRARHNVLKFICLGATIVFGIHVLINAGSVVGLVPVIGVPFSFLSYGGSHLLMNFVLLGMIQSIAREA